MENGTTQVPLESSRQPGYVKQYGRWRLVPMGWVYKDRPPTPENIVSIDAVFEDYELEVSRLEAQLKSMISQRNELRAINDKDSAEISRLQAENERLEKERDQAIKGHIRCCETNNENANKRMWAEEKLRTAEQEVERLHRENKKI